MLTRVPCPAPTAPSFRACHCLSGRADCGPLGPSSTFPTSRLPLLPPHGHRTSWPLSRVMLLLAARPATLPVFPRTHLVPLLGQTVPSRSNPPKLDSRCLLSHPHKEGQLPVFSGWEDSGDSPGSSAHVPRGTERCSSSVTPAPFLKSDGDPPRCGRFAWDTRWDAALRNARLCSRLLCLASNIFCLV